MSYERKTYDLYISDELREILTEIEHESLVASLLLKKRHNKEDLVDSPINFISISRDDKSKISYLTQDRMSSVDINDYWTTSRRFQAKPGAFVGKIFKNIPSKEVEIFSNLYRTTAFKPKFNFSVVSGESIRHFYYYETYASDRGTLGASCMKHSACQSMLDIYVDNRDIVTMLVMRNDEGLLMGRALLWNFDSYKIMDRIYTISDEELSFYFKKWATDNGYLYKSQQNWFNTLFFEQIGQKKQELRLSVKLKNFTYRKYPYVDTFKFFNPQTGELTNYMPDDQFYTLCASDGSKHSSDYLIFDGIDKVLRYRGEAQFVRYLNLWTSQNNLEWSDVNDQYILLRDCRFDEELNDFVFAGEFEKLNDNYRISERKKNIARSIKNIDMSEIASELGLDPSTIFQFLQRTRATGSQNTRNSEPDVPMDLSNI